MSWQDELRQLDEELAAGRLSAEDYRRRRDDLLSQSASTAGPLKPVLPPQPPPEPPSSPFPPPFRWDPSPAETTQQIRPIQDEPGTPPGAEPGIRPGVQPGTDPSAERRGDPGKEPAEPVESDAERTQVVAGGEQQPDAESTQIVAGQQPRFPHGPPGPPGQPRPHGQPGQPPGFQPVSPWQQQQGGEHAPPWSSWDLPQPDQSPAWLRQGPETFANVAPPGRGKRIALVGGAVVLVVAVVAAAVYLVTQRLNAPDNTAANNTTTEQAQPTTTTTTTTTTTKPPEGPPIADLPGTVTDTERIKAFADVEAIDYLTEEEANAYKATGAAATKLAIAHDGTAQIIVLITQHADATAARGGRDRLGNLQVSYGLAPLAAEAGVRAGSNDTAPGGPIRRAHYSAGGYVVRVQVQGKDLGQVDQLFAEVLGAQLDELPADAQ